MHASTLDRYRSGVRAILNTFYRMFGRDLVILRRIFVVQVSHIVIDAWTTC
jgi:hypothetical protein